MDSTFASVIPRCNLLKFSAVTPGLLLENCDITTDDATNAKVATMIVICMWRVTTAHSLSDQLRASDEISPTQHAVACSGAQGFLRL
jgi:hypothetical protein